MPNSEVFSVINYFRGVIPVYINKKERVIFMNDRKTDYETCSHLKFNLQLFGGLFGGDDSSKTTTTERNIPAQSANEAELENGLMGYNRSSLSGAQSALGKYMSAINGTYTPDWSTLADNYNKTMAGINSGYSTLANGELPSTYAAERQKALQSDLASTVGSSISGLANRGILNSSITNRALDDISQNASDTLAKQYSSDLSTQANLLGQQSSNALSTLSGNSTAQGASYVPASTLLSYANQLYSNPYSMYNTMYSGRMNSGGTTTTQTSSDNGKDGFWGGVGTLGAAAIKASACFTKDTLVSTPYGKKRISDLEVGDKVLSLNADDKIKIGTVIEVREPVKNHIVDVQFGNGSVWHTTDTQTVYTSPGMELVGDAVHQSITEDGERTPIMSVVDTGRIDNVYDVVIDGRNIFFVEGIAAEGFTEEE